MASEIYQILKKRVARLPLEPGVYQFINAEGKVIYVGKAKSLRKRVAQYFAEAKDLPPKTRIMVKNAVDIRHIVVGSEDDALFLENNLIKTLQPRYNVLLKDDKTYPWIVVRNEHFPRIHSTRRLIKDGSRYYGPYASVVVQKNVLELIKAIYPLRTCGLNLSPEQVARGKYRVCLEYHIGNCKGPCEGRQTEEDYEANVQGIKAILRGELRSTRRLLQTAMDQAAGEMNFELAEKFRVRLELLDSYISKSVIVSPSLGTLDVVSYLKDTDAVYCNFIRLVNGAVVNSFTAQFSPGLETEEVKIFSEAIRQIVDRLSGPLARTVLVPVMPDEGLFQGVEFIIPKRGDKLKLLEFSQRNCRLYRLEKMKNLEIKDPARHTERVMEAMRKALRMETQPRHIECFDNSNLQGTNPVASCVVFRDGKPSRKEYRHFNIKTVVGADDFASMREIIYRRYRRVMDEGTDLPDLIIVDGGKGQLSSAYAILRELGIDGRVKIVGLAKRIEEIYFPDDPNPYYLDRTGEPLRVVMHIRNEAHRFGITFHRKKRSLAFIKSELESIEGLGEVSVTKLLKKFRTVSAIKKATEDDLAAVVGRARARSVKKFYEGEKVGGTPENN